MNLVQLCDCFKKKKSFSKLLGLDKTVKDSMKSYKKGIGLARLMQTVCIMNQIAITFATFWVHRLALRACLANKYGECRYSPYDITTYKELECIVGYFLRKVDADPEIKDLDRGEKLLHLAQYMMKLLHSGIFMQSIFSIAGGSGKPLARARLDAGAPQNGKEDVATFYSARFDVIAPYVAELGGKLPDLQCHDEVPSPEKSKSNHPETQDGSTLLHDPIFGCQETSDLQAQKISHLFHLLEQSGLVPADGEKKAEEEFCLSQKSPRTLVAASGISSNGSAGDGKFRLPFVKSPLQVTDVKYHNDGEQQDGDEVEQVNSVPPYHEEEKDGGCGVKHQRDSSEDETPHSKKPNI